MQTPLFGAFHALAIDDGGSWTGFPLRLFTTLLIKRVVDALQCAVIGPQIEIVVDRAFRRQVCRDCAPLTAGRQNVHKAGHHLAHDHRPFASARLAGRDQRYNQLPFLVGHIARIAQLAAVIARAIHARPHRCPPNQGHRS
jgi:hypothetical protein